MKKIEKAESPMSATDPPPIRHRSAIDPPSIRHRIAAVAPRPFVLEGRADRPRLRYRAFEFPHPDLENRTNPHNKKSTPQAKMKTCGEAPEFGPSKPSPSRLSPTDAPVRLAPVFIARAGLAVPTDA